jgi:hypothetical protein
MFSRPATPNRCQHGLPHLRLVFLGAGFSSGSNLTETESSSLVTSTGLEMSMYSPVSLETGFLGSWDMSSPI